MVISDHRLIKREFPSKREIDNIKEGEFVGKKYLIATTKNRVTLIDYWDRIIDYIKILPDRNWRIRTDDIFIFKIVIIGTDRGCSKSIRFEKWNLDTQEKWILYNNQKICIFYIKYTIIVNLSRHLGTWRICKLCRVRESSDLILMDEIC